MTFINIIFLGFLQGLTEFLPVSSSGHLVLGQFFLGIKQPCNEFEVLVHLGTLFSVLIIFYSDIKSIILNISDKETQRFLLFLFIGTLPAVLIGFEFKDFMENLFENPKAVSGALLFTGIILIISIFSKKNTGNRTYLQGFVIGCAQAISIIPGISRSGMTICTALFLGLSPSEAARVSFLLAIPIISGAGLLTAFDIQTNSSLPIDVAIGGFLSSFVIGLLSLNWFLGWLEKGKLHWFGFYCFILGTLTLIF